MTWRCRLLVIAVGCVALSCAEDDKPPPIVIPDGSLFPQKDTQAQPDAGTPFPPPDGAPTADRGPSPDDGGQGDMFDAATDATDVPGMDSSEDLGWPAADGTDGGGDDAPADTALWQPPTFQQIYEDVLLTQGCSGGSCHGSAAGGFVITDQAGTYFQLAGQPATNPLCGLAKRVEPGDPDSSILWHRVRPSDLDSTDAPCAPKMPKGSEGLDDDLAQLIYDWIAAGALQ